MKTFYKVSSVLLLVPVLLACSNDDELTTNQGVANKEALTSNQAQAVIKPVSDYQMPTYIGADKKGQEALLAQLEGQKALSELEQKQQLLLRLTLFASDKNQTLEKLQTITDDLNRASDESAKRGQQDYELLAAWGSALSYQSIFYQADLGQMNLLSRKGMRYMDRAVKKAPDHLGVRLLRGVSYANMPAFLNRASFAVTDLSLLKEVLLKESGSSAELIKKQPKNNQNKLFIEFIDYYLALSFSKNTQLDAAKRLWKALETSPESQWSALAKQRLEEV